MTKIAALAHGAWRHLPYRARRRLLFGLADLAAAEPSTNCQPRQPIFIAGFLSAASGLGECARLFHDAYKRAGAEVYGVDLAGLFRQGKQIADFRFDDGRRHRGPGTVMLHISGSLVPLASVALGRRFLAGKWRIGYWAWELPLLPPDWHAGARYLHEVWAISQFTCAALAPALQKPIRVALPPVVPRRAMHDGTQVYRRTSGADFVALVAFNMASGFARKNPLAAIAAFKAAFGGDSGALLIVKVANADVHPAGRLALEQACASHCNIVLICETMPDQALMDLLAGADVVLSLHRAEGFGLLLAHAMHFGKPVIATDWSASCEFLTRDNACLVPATLAPAHDPQKTYDYPDASWAEPSVHSAADWLRRLRTDRSFAAAVGRRAQQDAAALFAPSRLPRFAPPAPSRPFFGPIAAALAGR